MGKKHASQYVNFGWLRPAFNGLYLAIVKADRGAKGELHFSVESDGLGTAEMVFQIEKGKIRQYQYIP